MPKKIVSETLLFPVILHREENTWGYFCPNLGGGGAATQADALQQATDMITTELAHCAANGTDQPQPTPIDEIDADGGQIVLIPVTQSNAAERISLTFPTDLLALVDAHTENRSAFFAELARERLHQG